MVNYEDAGPRMLAITITATVIALLTLITRLYVRIKMIRNVGWDDYLMIVAMILGIVGQVIIVPEVGYGGGKHIGAMSDYDYMMASKLNYITQPFYAMAISFVKVSIGFFLLRVAVVPFYRRTLIAIMVFVGIYTVFSLVGILGQCTNLATRWDPSIKANCWDSKVLKAFSYTSASLNILTDLLFAVIIPIPMLWNIQMNMRQKGTVIGILALGVFGTAAALVKTSYLTTFGRFNDFLWDSSNITIWTVLELNVGIVCGNLPCMKPLFRRALGSTYGRGTAKTSNARNHFSRPYGAGTGHTGKDYNSLASGRTQGGASSPYGGKEAYMMTTMPVQNPADSTSQSSLKEEHPGKTSTESVQWLKEPSPGKYGGIMKTTEVSVSGSNDRGEGYEDGISMERQAVHMV